MNTVMHLLLMNRLCCCMKKMNKPVPNSNVPLPATQINVTKARTRGWKWRAGAPTLKNT
jgi:hypothetical protein